VRHLILLLLCFTPLLSSAQEDSVYHSRWLHPRNHADSIVREHYDKIQQHRASRTFDSLLDLRDQRAKYDRTYIQKPTERWTFRIRENISGTHLHINSKTDNTETDIRLWADCQFTTAFSASYRGFGASFSVNPRRWFGKSKDVTFNTMSYGNRFGYSLNYSLTNTLRGRIEQNDVKSSLTKGRVKQKMLNFDAYYAFNGRHFSYAAAFTQSQIQLKSCGSWLIGMAYTGGNITTNIDDDEEAEIKLKIKQLGIGAGYGYNLVLRNNWLLHASAIPQFVIYNHSTYRNQDGISKLSFHFPNLINTGQAALVHSHKNKFYGLNVIIKHNIAGNLKNLRISNVRWRLRLFYGFRL